MPAVNHWTGGSLQDGAVPAATQAPMSHAEVALEPTLACMILISQMLQHFLDLWQDALQVAREQANMVVAIEAGRLPGCSRNAFNKQFVFVCFPI